LLDQESNDAEKKWDTFGQIEFNKIHNQHWQIEQVCNIENFQVRNKIAVMNHLFSAICGYAKLQQMRATEVIKNCYRLQRDLF
jgi:hypothetical protein